MEQTSAQGRGQFGVGWPTLQPILKTFRSGRGEEGLSRFQTFPTVQPFPPPPTQSGRGADLQPVS